jgi:recombinational DNA repair protein (RecF pathway)
MTLRCTRCILTGNGLGDDAEYIHKGESLCFRCFDAIRVAHSERSTT